MKWNDNHGIEREKWFFLLFENDNDIYESVKFIHIYSTIIIWFDLLFIIIKWKIYWKKGMNRKVGKSWIDTIESI